MSEREELIELLYRLGVPFAASLLEVLEANGYTVEKKEADHALD